MSNMPTTIVTEAPNASLSGAKPKVIHPRAGYVVSRPFPRFLAKFDNSTAQRLGLSGMSSPDGKATLVPAVGLSGNPGHSAKAKLIVADDVNGMGFRRLSITSAQAFAAKSIAQSNPTGVPGIDLLPEVDFTRKAMARATVQVASAKLVTKHTASSQEGLEIRTPLRPEVLPDEVGALQDLMKRGSAYSSRSRDSQPI